GMRRGLEQPLRQHSFELDLFKNHNSVDGYVYKDYLKALSVGSFGDRYQVLSKGFRIDSTMFGLPVSRTGRSDFISGQAMTGLTGKWFAFLGASIQTIAYDYLWGVTLYGIGHYIVKMNQSLNQLQHRVSD